MALEIKKLADHVGVEVKGVDASKPFDEETLKTVYKAWVDHSVLVLKGQDLTPQQFVEFSRQFGKPIEQNLKHLNVDGCPELAFISSEDRDIHGTGKRIVRGTSWPRAAEVNCVSPPHSTHCPRKNAADWPACGPSMHSRAAAARGPW
jgi:alpha-ketoglutarate-dependent taurine dioxygenase